MMLNKNPRWQLVDAEEGTYAFVHRFPSRVNYYFFSSRLKEGHESSLEKLTVTVVAMEDGRKRRFYSNFDPMNEAILTTFMGESRVSALGNEEETASS